MIKKIKSNDLLTIKLSLDEFLKENEEYNIELIISKDYIFIKIYFLGDYIGDYILTNYDKEFNYIVFTRYFNNKKDCFKFCISKI